MINNSPRHVENSDQEITENDTPEVIEGVDEEEEGASENEGTVVVDPGDNPQSAPEFDLGAFSLMFSIIAIITFVIEIISIISLWKIFTKAGEKGWKSLIPIYNIVVLLRIVDLSIVYLILFFIPIVQIYPLIKVCIELAKKFGKDVVFGVLTAFFPFVCLPILGLGNATYLSNNDQNDSQGNPYYDNNGAPNLNEQPQNNSFYDSQNDMNNYNQVNDQFNNQMNNQPTGQYGNQMNNQIGNQVGNQTVDQVGNQIGGQPAPQNYNNLSHTNSPEPSINNNTKVCPNCGSIVPLYQDVCPNCNNPFGVVNNNN